AEVPMPLMSAGLHSSALVSSSIGSPSEMPVPTELPTSPVSETDEVQTVPEPTIFSGGEPTRQLDEIPFKSSGLHSSAMGPSSSQLESPSEMPVPTEMPTSPMSDREAPPTRISGELGSWWAEDIPLQFRSSGVHSSALGPGSSQFIDSPSEMPVPTEMPTSPTSLEVLEAGTGEPTQTQLPGARESRPPRCQCPQRCPPALRWTLERHHYLCPLRPCLKAKKRQRCKRPRCQCR
ncbi:unnamed protein product, partial [Durusdinium trenchii]